MNTMMKQLAPAVLAFVLAGCAQPPPAAPVEPPDTRAAHAAAIRSASKGWPASAQPKDHEKFTTYYADDAVLMIEGWPDFKGLPAIRDAVNGMMQDPNFALSFDTTSVDVARSGDVAYEMCTYSFTISDPKTKQPATQK